mgnify:CR=1 FL=1
MRHTKLIHHSEKMTKTIPLRVYPSLAKRIEELAKKYGISQQDALRLAIQAGLESLDEFLTAKTKGTRDE